ncbi:MAG: DEAD/DEAH box helicase [Myxococcota bacterium]|nr:DEAD/DEAH box helicase [Myxococcota bacterium]
MLPIEPMRPAFEQAVRTRHVVLSAPTGSGKSTRVPIWASQLGRTLVIEPRRVACRSLAARISDTMGVPLGDVVGYRVRDDDRSSPETRVLFVTPGIALKMMIHEQDLSSFRVVILDEFHERTQDVDLIYAVLSMARAHGFVVMSATLDGARIADHLGGVHLSGEGRSYPVEVTYLGRDGDKPRADHLASRTLNALSTLSGINGDVLIFLPGKREIAACRAAASEWSQANNFEMMALHGELSLDQQNRVFRRSLRRKLIFSTNVAETSVTVPGVKAVIDSGLVRRTRYYDGRGFLTLMPIAEDSAEQRRGRAGRIAPGQCLRLWSAQARLQSATPPEVFRESVVPIVFHCAAIGVKADELAFLDSPKPEALREAEKELTALDAVSPSGHITETGRALSGLPLDLPLGRLIVGARETDVLTDMLDLVATLCVNRPFFDGRLVGDHPTLDHAGCDVEARIKGLRAADPSTFCVHPDAHREARHARTRLSRSFHHYPMPDVNRFIDRRALALVSLNADRRTAYVGRKRKHRVAWSNGGTERTVARTSLLAHVLDNEPSQKIEALVAYESRAMGRGEHDGEVMLTVVMPAHLNWFDAVKLGRVHVVSACVVDGVLHAEIERRHARKCLSSRLVVPNGDEAVTALVTGLMTDRIWPGHRSEVEAHLERLDLATQLGLVEATPAGRGVDGVQAWLQTRLVDLGFVTGEDFSLLDRRDLRPEPLPDAVRGSLDKTFPQALELPDASYRIRYDVKKRTAYLEPDGGRKGFRPAIRMLPKLDGYRVVLKDHRGESVLRSRR